MPIPTPKPSETENDFSVRCHEALADEIDNTEQRNAVCFRVWRESGKPSEAETYAASRFNPDEYRKVENVPVFAEHSTKDREGNLVVYDKAALKAVCDRCNERIEDTGDFAPIIEGHTPDREQLAAGARMPDVLGYAGPYRMGMIGNKSPRWAIFADEWHDKSEANRLKKLRRRSPEVWLEERMEDRFMDPIAALGAETPRLDMGMVRMCRAADGRLIEKYTAAEPSAMTVFVPSDDPKKKHAAQPPEENEMPLSPEDVEQVVGALMETDAMQWVQSQMNSGPQMTAPDGGEMGNEPPPEAGTVPAPDAGGPPMDDEMQGYMSRYMSGEMEEDEFQEYMSGRRSSYMADGSGGAGEGGINPPEGDVSEAELMKFGKGQPTAVGFTRMATQLRRFKQDYAREKHAREELEKRLGRIESDKQHAERYSMLQQLEREDGVLFELDEEYERTKDWPEDRFRDHIQTMLDHYQRVPHDRAVPHLHVPEGGSGQSDKYQKKLNDRAVEIATQKQKEGETVTYSKALELAKQEMNVTAAS